MLKSTTVASAGLFCLLVLFGPDGAAEEEAIKNPQDHSAGLREQTRDGVTVRIEKIAVERVFNSVGWLRKQYGANWRKETPPGFQPEPFQVVRVFVSVISDGTEASRPKKSGGSLDLGTTPSSRSRSKRESGSEWAPFISAHFDPGPWQRQLPDLEVDPAGRGAIFTAVVRDSVDVHDLFPAKVSFEVTTNNGKELKFVFPDLKF